MIIPEKITEIARKLRKNMTDSERLLWKEIRSKKLGVKFLRQHPFNIMMEDSTQARCVIVDFYCHEYRLIIEIDGGIHDISEVCELDKEKESLLLAQGYQILRFTNKQVSSNMTFVLNRIKQELDL